MKIIDEDLVRYHGLSGKSEDYKAGYMAAFQGHDDAATIIDSVSLLSPHSTEVIIIKFNTEEISFETASYIMENIRNQFPYNIVIALPDKIYLESCSKDVLENYISMIQEVVDKS